MTLARAHIRFAHRLLDSGVDIVHGHSFHHPRPIEVYRNRIIFYSLGMKITVPCGNRESQ